MIAVPCILLAIVLPLVLLASEVSDNNEHQWKWDCIEDYCKKIRITPDTRNSAVNLPTCTLFCSKYAVLWPKPNGEFRTGSYSIQLNINSIVLQSSYASTPIGDRIKSAWNRFEDILNKLLPPKSSMGGGESLHVNLQITTPTVTRLTLDIDESYTLEIQEADNKKLSATITAKNYFGFRHGLETLSQLIVYDDIRDQLHIPAEVYIKDKPVYPYRGISLDTSRNYISVDSIKRTLEGMALSKLNTFHWHITDSHSFPYVSKSRPQLSQIGAYSPSKIYNSEDIAEIIEYGLVRGVRVMPEFDAPAHVGEGWQDTEFVACFNKQPWQEFCVEPPCGQLDPTKDGLYDFLEGIYEDMVEQFQPDIFHMGGDEVAFSCWNTTDTIVKWMTDEGWGTTESDFVKLWNLFQSKAAERYTKQAGKKTPIILWSSTLTEKEYVEEYLPNDRYIIQFWTNSTDEIQDLLERNYRVILSNFDYLYLDCGFGAWTREGNNWCSPYKGWHLVYEFSPAEVAGTRVEQVLGAEAALWAEQLGDIAIDTRLWPRAAALAERLWAEPEDSWRKAEQRMLLHRERLVRSGIAADALVPEWCMQNEENCPDGAAFNK